MGRVVVSEFVSLDGVMEAPGPSHDYAHAGWTLKFQDPAGMQYKLQETLDHDALLLGRVTYEGFAAAWPAAKDDVGFADKMNAMPKHVVSSTLTDPAWNNTSVISGDVAAAVTGLKESSEGDILVAGSATLVRHLLAHGLIDELRLMVFPIVLGSGLRLFAETGQPAVLRLSGSRALDSGSVILTYTAPAADAGLG